MIARTVLLLSLVLAHANLHAQKTDSLWSAWNDPSNHDTLRLDALNRLIRAVRTDADSAYSFALQQEHFAQKLNLHDWRIRALEHQANSLLKKGDVPAAIAKYDAILADQQCRNDSAGVAGTLRSKASTLYKAGDFNRASELYHQALRIRDALGDTLGAARIMTSLGILSMDHGDPEKALAYYTKSLAMHIAAGDSVNTGVLLNTICTPLRSLDLCEEALANNRRALKIHERAGRPIGVAASLNHMAAAYNRMGQPEKALDHARRSMRIRIDIADTVGVAYAQLQVAKALIQLDRPAAAANAASDALRIGTNLVQMPIRAEAAELLHKAYRVMGDWRRALEMHELRLQLDDSLSGAKTKRALISRDLQYKYDKEAFADSLERVRQAEDLRCSYDGQLQVEKERRTRAIMVGGTVALALGIIAFLLVHRLRQAKRLREQEAILHDQQVDQLLAQQELKSINAMLEGQEKERDRMGKDLHDRLGGMLGGIKANMSALEDRVEQVRDDHQYKKVNHLLDQAVSELRQISHDMAAATLSRFGLEKALKDLRDTLHITGRMQVELKAFGLDQRLERSVEIALYRIVQELVSNVLKHAKASELIIGVTRTPGRLSVVVSDNGAGFDATQRTDGMGLGNVRSRAAAIGATVQVDSTPGKGTTVSVECPVVE
ncbi:MAG: sensor histidine kinase [Flavobacteriales bacterium]|nr:sensor histidine kinase [Flavobacteriales bacterium]